MSEHLIEDFAPLLYTILVEGKPSIKLDMQSWSLSAQVVEPARDEGRQLVLSLYQSDEGSSAVVEVIERASASKTYDCVSHMEDRIFVGNAVYACALDAQQSLSPELGQQIMRACLHAKLSPLSAAELCRQLSAW